jgi:hypothetical protein
MDSLHFPQLIGKSVSCCRIACTECLGKVFVSHTTLSDCKLIAVFRDQNRTTDKPGILSKCWGFAVATL